MLLAMKLFTAIVFVLGALSAVTSAQYYINCTTPLGENVFGNPQFQTTNGTDIPPWSTDGTVQIVPNEAGPGNAAQFTVMLEQGRTPADTTLTQKIPFCGTHQFLISIDYKVEQLTPTPMKYANATNKPLRIKVTAGDLFLNRNFEFDDAELGKWVTIQTSVGGVGAQLPFFLMELTAAESTLEPDDSPVFFQVTVANPSYARLPRGPLPMAGKGKGLVANGGFESGRLAPWKESIIINKDVYIYPTTHGRPCVPGARTFDIASPGLPAKVGTPKSSFKAHFCANITSRRTGQRAPEAQALLKQKTAPTVLGKPYVLTVEFNASPLFDILVIYGPISYASGVPIYTNPGEYMAGNETIVYQRIFTGLGHATTLVLGFDAVQSEEDILEVFVDNISIRPLDEKALKGMVSGGEAL